MDKNSIDIKIREFAIYLKELGLLNEINIKDFLKTFKNQMEREQYSLNNFKNDINFELIYLKENLAKAMLEFFNLITKEGKRSIYLNIYSKFLQKREKDLFVKGNILYKLYFSLIIKKYFFRWKGENTNIINKKYENKAIDITYTLNNFKNLQKDNFCFGIISDNNKDTKNNVIINSNNHKIIFNSNKNNKNENSSTINSYTDINSLFLSTKSTVFNSNNNIILNTNNFKNKLFIDNNIKQKNHNFKTIEYNDKKNIIYENFEQQKKDEQKNVDKHKQNIKTNKYQQLKGSHKSFDRGNHSINNDNVNRRKKNFIRLIEKGNNKNGVNIKTMRKTYNSNRPISNFNYDEYNKKNVYRRLYEQNIEYNKRKEQRIEENIKEIKERSNHPIIKNNSISKLNNLKKNFAIKEYNKMKKNNDTFNRNSINTIESQKNSKKISNTIESKNIIYEKEYRYSDFDKNNEEKTKKGQNFMENQRECILLFNEMINNEEKRLGKKYNEQEKEKKFKELLDKIYHEYKNNEIKDE